MNGFAACFFFFFLNGYVYVDDGITAGFSEGVDCEGLFYMYCSVDIARDMLGVFVFDSFKETDYRPMYRLMYGILYWRNMLSFFFLLFFSSFFNLHISTNKISPLPGISAVVIPSTAFLKRIINLSVPVTRLHIIGIDSSQMWYI